MNRNIQRLKQEADWNPSDLYEFIELAIVADPESMLGPAVQDDAAHRLTVWLMAYQLRRAFRAFPDPVGEVIIEKNPFVAVREAH